MTALAVSARCLTTCGVLAAGLTTDPPDNPRRASRWAELDALAERHTKSTGHVTYVSGTTTGGAT